MANPEIFLDGRVTLYAGDCTAIMPQLPDNSIDSCVTDPPYHLTSIVKRFGAENAAPANVGKTGAYARASSGFMGKKWDGGDIAFRPELWAEVYRVLKPGAHLLAFGGTRTYHRMACAIEDAGFEIRDQLQWLYGSGFPKSHDVSKGIDRAAGVDRPRISGGIGSKTGDTYSAYGGYVAGEAISGEAIEWQGFGTALKPACEPIVLARKPLSESTVAANVLKWGTGALNIDRCRVAIDESVDDPRLGGKGDWSSDKMAKNVYEGGYAGVRVGSSEKGRWPANVIHDGSQEVVEAFPAEAGAFAPVRGTEPSNAVTNVYGERQRTATFHHGDCGSAARFFYTAKANADDRLGSKHPTVKPVDLIQYLARLVTPPKGLILDPFAGTGTLGEACFREGFNAVLIEREAEYQADIARRMKLCLAGPDERNREAIKARGQTADPGPLFGGKQESWDDMWKRPYTGPVD